MRVRVRQQLFATLAALAPLEPLTHAPGGRRRRAKWPVTSASAPRPRACASSASNLMARLQARSGLGVSPRAYLQRHGEVQVVNVLPRGLNATVQGALCHRP
jgi:hypothetical protein